MYPHDRAHYRISYPAAARPHFLPQYAPTTLPVVDCSETGFRFRADAGAGALPAPGEQALGRIRFRSGAEVQVVGRVVRVQEDEVAVHLDESTIPFRVVLQEQVFLRQRFPFGLS